MSPSAQRLQIDFVRFAGEEGSSLYWDQFLRHGTVDWPDGLRRRFAALERWRGVADLKCRLKRLAGARSGGEVLLANRSAQLMRLAAGLLLDRCQNVLVTDLTWPSYGRILKARQRATGRRLTRVALRRQILRDQMGPDELIAHLARRYVAHHCDGLFLPAVDNLGIRLPIPKIVRTIRRQAAVRFVVTDAAQALGHIPLAATLGASDFVLAGCHKWLRGFQPMGLGFLKARQTLEKGPATRREMLAPGMLTDPLLSFTAELEGAPACRFGETVQVGPMFSCLGAVHDRLNRGRHPAAQHRAQLENAHHLQGLLDRRYWRPVLPHHAFRSGIMLLRQETAAGHTLPAKELRRWFHQRHMAVTTYDSGLVRLSMPQRRFTPQELRLLMSTLGRPMHPNAAHDRNQIKSLSRVLPTFV